MKKIRNQIKMWKYARKEYERACFEHELAVLNVKWTLDAISRQNRALEKYRDAGAAGVGLVACTISCLERYGEMLEDDALTFELACEDIELWRDIGTMSLPRYLMEGFFK